MTIIEKMDKFDQIIIFELMNNSRISIKEISKLLNRSKSFVIYRLNKLISEEIIERTYSLIDLPKLGFLPFEAYIKLNAAKNEEEEFIEKLKLNKKIYYVERLIGGYSIRFSFFERNIILAQRLIKSLFESKHNNLEKYQILPITSLIKTNNVPFDFQKSGNRMKIFSEQKK